MNKHAYVLFYEKITDFVSKQEASGIDLSPLESVFSSMTSNKNVRNNFTSSVNNTRTSTNNKPPLGRGPTTGNSLRTLKEISLHGKKHTMESGSSTRNNWVMRMG